MNKYFVLNILGIRRRNYQKSQLPMKQLAPHISAPFALCFTVTRIFFSSVKIAMPSKSSLVFSTILPVDQDEM